MATNKITYTCTDGKLAGKSLTGGTPDTYEGMSVVIFDSIRVNGKLIRPICRTESRPDLAMLATEYTAAETQARETKLQLKRQHVQGLDELREAQYAATDEADRYQDEFRAMMEDEYNDGCRPPRQMDASLGERAAALAREYPRAAVYLRAEASSHHATYTGFAAGDQMAALLRGESLEHVAEIMDRAIAKAAML